MSKAFFLLVLILKNEEGVCSSLAQQIHQKLKERVSNQKAFMATQCDRKAFYKKRIMKIILGVVFYSLGCWIRRLGLSFIVSRQKDQRGARLTLCTRR